MAFVDLERDHLVLDVLLAGPPASGKSTRLWQIGHATGERRVDEFGRTPLGPQRMATLPLDVERRGRDVVMEVYEWHGPERADARGRGLLTHLDGLVYLADARAERLIDTVRQLEFLVERLGRSTLRRLPTVLALGRMDEGALRLPRIEAELMEITWGQRLELPFEDAAGFVEAMRLLGEAILLREV